MIELLVADDDAGARALAAARARETVGGLTVLEAADGAEAIQVGLQQRPDVALLDVSMPRLGGIEAALTLRALLPDTTVALWTGDPGSHRAEARELGLLLFEKNDVDGAVRWLDAHARRLRELPFRSSASQKLRLECTGCGYGIVCTSPPERCPMCHGEHAWRHGAWRPFGMRAAG